MRRRRRCIVRFETPQSCCVEDGMLRVINEKPARMLGALKSQKSAANLASDRPLF